MIANSSRFAQANTTGNAAALARGAPNIMMRKMCWSVHGRERRHWPLYPHAPLPEDTSVCRPALSLFSASRCCRSLGANSDDSSDLAAAPDRAMAAQHRPDSMRLSISTPGIRGVGCRMKNSRVSFQPSLFRHSVAIGPEASCSITIHGLIKLLN